MFCRHQDCGNRTHYAWRRTASQSVTQFQLHNRITRTGTLLYELNHRPPISHDLNLYIRLHHKSSSTNHPQTTTCTKGLCVTTSLRRFFKHLNLSTKGTRRRLCQYALLSKSRLPLTLLFIQCYLRGSNGRAGHLDPTFGTDCSVILPLVEKGASAPTSNSWPQTGHTFRRGQAPSALPPPRERK